METLHLSNWTHILLVVIVVAALGALMMGYVYMSVGRSRHRWLRVGFFTVQACLIFLIAFVNLRADAELQVRARQQMCRKRMDRIGALLLDARRLHDGRLPPTLDALRELPAFRPAWRVSPLTDLPYRYERSDPHHAVLTGPPAAAPGWLGRTTGHWRLSIDGDTATRRFVWISGP